MCRPHNAYLAEVDYGRARMEQYRAQCARRRNVPVGRSAVSDEAWREAEGATRQ
jgi:hypothetical protein